MNFWWKTFVCQIPFFNEILKKFWSREWMISLTVWSQSGKLRLQPAPENEPSIVGTPHFLLINSQLPKKSGSNPVPDPGIIDNTHHTTLHGGAYTIRVGPSSTRISKSITLPKNPYISPHFGSGLFNQIWRGLSVLLHPPNQRTAHLPVQEWLNPVIWDRGIDLLEMGLCT